MTLAVWFQPSAIEIEGTAVAMALVSPPWFGAGFGIEGFELAGPAGHPEQDARHLPLAQIGGMEGHPIGEADRYRRRHGQAGRPQRDRLEKVAAVDHAGAVHRHLHQFLFRVPWSSPRSFPRDGSNDRVRFNRNRLGEARGLAPGQELGGVDQAPVNVFECLAAIADAREIAAADLDFVRRGLARQNANIERAERRTLVGRRGAGFRPEPLPGLACIRLLISGLFIKNRA